MNETQKAIAELHKTEGRMRGTPGSEEPDFYDVCVHCTDLLNIGAATDQDAWEEVWPCPTAIAAGLPEASFEDAMAGSDVPTATEAPF